MPWTEVYPKKSPSHRTHGGVTFGIRDKSFTATLGLGSNLVAQLGWKPGQALTIDRGDADMAGKIRIKPGTGGSLSLVKIGHAHRLFLARFDGLARCALERQHCEFTVDGARLIIELPPGALEG